MLSGRRRVDNKGGDSRKAELRLNGFSHRLISPCHTYDNTGHQFVFELQYTVKYINRTQADINNS